MTLGKSLLLPKLVSSFVPKGFLEESMRQHVFGLTGPGTHWKVKCEPGISVLFRRRKEASVPRTQWVFLLSSLQALGGVASATESCESRGPVEGIPEQLRAAQSQSELALVSGAA